MQVGANDGLWELGNDPVQPLLAAGMYDGVLLEPVPWLASQLYTSAQGWRGRVAVIQGAVCEGLLHLWALHGPSFRAANPRAPHWLVNELAVERRADLISRAQLCKQVPGRAPGRTQRKKGKYVVRRCSGLEHIREVVANCTPAASVLAHPLLRGAQPDAVVLDAEGADHAILHRFLAAGARPAAFSLEKTAGAVGWDLLPATKLLLTGAGYVVCPPCAGSGDAVAVQRALRSSACGPA